MVGRRRGYEVLQGICENLMGGVRAQPVMAISNICTMETSASTAAKVKILTVALGCWLGSLLTKAHSSKTLGPQSRRFATVGIGHGPINSARPNLLALTPPSSGSTLTTLP